MGPFSRLRRWGRPGSRRRSHLFLRLKMTRSPLFFPFSCYFPSPCRLPLPEHHLCTAIVPLAFLLFWLHMRAGEKRLYSPLLLRSRHAFYLTRRVSAPALMRESPFNHDNEGYDLAASILMMGGICANFFCSQEACPCFGDDIAHPDPFYRSRFVKRQVTLPGLCFSAPPTPSLHTSLRPPSFFNLLFSPTRSLG